MTELETRLTQFLEAQEEAKKHGVTLESVYKAARDMADQLLRFESREQLWREELRKELLSAMHRIRNLEADLVGLRSRLEALEEAFRASALQPQMASG